MRYFTVCHTLLYAILYCMPYFTVCHTLLYAILYCMRYFTACHTLLYAILYCMRYFTVCHTLQFALTRIVSMRPLKLYLEWPHRQGGCLACWRLQGCKIEFPLWLSCDDLYYARGAQGVRPIRVGGMTNQLDLLSLTPLSVAGCGRLQLGVPHWVTSLDYCK